MTTSALCQYGAVPELLLLPTLPKSDWAAYDEKELASEAQPLPLAVVGSSSGLMGSHSTCRK